MKCNNCGALIQMNQKFCPNCGSPNVEFKKHIFAEQLQKPASGSPRLASVPTANTS